MIKIGEQYNFCCGKIFNLTSCRSGFSLTSFIQMQYVINELSRLTARGFDILTYALVSSFFFFFTFFFGNHLFQRYNMLTKLKKNWKFYITRWYIYSIQKLLSMNCFVRLSQNWKDGKNTKWNHVNSWEGIGGHCHLFDIIC